MPKAFENQEREAIAESLLRVGLDRFSQSGIRSARVDDICRDVGIAKGSFYSFFGSKEELFMAIVEQREAMHRDDMAEFLSTSRGAAVEVAGQFFDRTMVQIETDPVLNIVLANGEMAYLVRKLGPQRFEAGQRADEEFGATAAALWSAVPGRHAIPAGDLLSLLTIMLTLATQRANMTDGQYQPAVALLRSMFVDQLTRSPR